MLPDQFYMSGLGIIIYLILYLAPLTVFFWSLWRNTKLPLIGIVPIGLVLATLPLWDVYMTSLDASRLCKEQGGLHVYKTADANSFGGGGNIVKLSKHGFKYAEAGYRGKLIRRMVVEGELVMHEVKAISTRYSDADRGYQIINNKIGSNAIQMLDLQTGDVLGELVTFNIHPGWFDSLALGWAGKILWHCGNEIPAGRAEPLNTDDLILATLKPKGSEVSQ
ncbi:hypothetical protein ACFL4M_01190 [Pseudomonadota bacterium]